MKISADIETVDPTLLEVKPNRSYLDGDFRLLDVGIFYLCPIKNEGIFKTFQDVESFNAYLIGLVKEYSLSSTKDIELIFHNLSYDYPRLKFLGFPVLDYSYNDTMLIASLVNSSAWSLSLANLTEEYNTKYKKKKDSISKEDFKDLEGFKLEEHDTYYEYLEYDVKSTYELALRLEKKIEILSKLPYMYYQIGNIKDVYQTEKNILIPVNEMSYRGIKVDEYKLKKEFPDFIKKASEETEGFLHNLLNTPEELLSISTPDIFNKWKDRIDKLEVEYKGVFSKHINYLKERVYKLGELTRENKIGWKLFLGDHLVISKNTATTIGFKKLLESCILECNSSIPISLYKNKVLSLKASNRIAIEKLCNNIESKILFIYLKDYSNIKTTYVDKVLKPFEYQFNNYGCLFASFQAYRSERGGTVTGRFSCSKINLQQLHKGYDHKHGLVKKSEIDTLTGELRLGEFHYVVKSLIVPPEGKVIIESDDKAQEVLIANCVIKNENYIREFQNNIDADAHSFVASMIFDSLPTIDDLEESEAENYQYFEFDNFKGWVKKTDRQKAKGFSFGINYGQGVKGVAMSLGISIEEAQNIVDKYNSNMPQLNSCFKSLIDYSLTHNYLPNIYGRLYKLRYSFKNHYFRQEYISFFRMEEMKVGRGISKADVINHFKETDKDIKNNIKRIINLSFNDFYREFKEIVSPMEVLKEEDIRFIYNDINSSVKKPLSKLITLLKSKDYVKDLVDEDYILKLIVLIDVVYKANIYKTEDYAEHIKRDIDFLENNVAIRNDITKDQYFNDTENLKKQFSFSKDLSFAVEKGNYKNLVWLILHRGDLNGKGYNYIDTVSLNVTFNWLKKSYSQIKKLFNSVCQSSGADMIKRRIDIYWRFGKPLFPTSDLWNTTHDSMSFCVGLEEKEPFSKWCHDNLIVLDLQTPIRQEIIIYEKNWGLDGKEYK